MEDCDIKPLFGGSDSPGLDISYGHFQADSHLLKAASHVRELNFFLTFTSFMHYYDSEVEIKNTSVCFWKACGHKY